MPPCRCLLSETDQKEMSKAVRELIDLMPEEKKAGEEVRMNRLNICKQCGHLMDGTCALCGCYVELRSAVKAQCCPDVPKRWDACAGDGEDMSE